MRESCSCGAAIQTISYKRAVTWRLTHLHGESEPDHIDLESETQIMGFVPNDHYDEEED